MDCDPSGTGRRDPTPSYHTPPEASTPYSVEMEDPTSYPFPASHFTHPTYPSVPPQMWSQAQLQQFQLTGRARDDRQFLTEDQRRELEMRVINNHYNGVSYESSPQNLADFFNPAVGPHFHPGPSVPSDRTQTFHPSQYSEGRQESNPYIPSGYYNPAPFPPNLLPFGMPAYPPYGGVPYFQSVPSQRRSKDDDGASVDAPNAESVENVGNWLQAGPFPPLPDDPTMQGHEPPQASTSSSASSDVYVSAHAGPSRSSPPTSLPPARPGARKNKRYIVQRDVSCQICTDPIGTLLLRGTRDELDVRHELVYECSKHSSTPPPTTLGRKRTRQPEDIRLACVCDVCGRTRGRGGIIPKDQGQMIGFAVEVVCKTCFQRYQRCSDCGGGSGRVMVGKWRCKELFEKGRKTCKLPHARLGGGEIEIGTWPVDELKDHPEFEQVFGQCRKLWEDRVLGKLGIPEFLEHDSDEHSRTYADLASMLERGYPFEKTLDHKFDENRPHRRYVSFIWQRLRSRREKQPSTPTPTRSPSEESSNPSMVLAPHVRRTLDFNVEGATVISMYLTDWDMRTGTVCLHTSLAFDTNDIDDKAVISLGEMIPRMLAEREKWNAEHPTEPIPTPRHVWNNFQSSSSLLTARWTDLMTKRGFVNIEEYLSIHTDVDRQDFAPPAYGFLWHDDPDWRPLGPVRPDSVTMCKFIAEDLDPVILERLRQIEMTKKAGRRKRST
ncbi:hypothetical protein V565_075170 [Rhizoctonia solani 123E]|uniref:Uncharacterized protein n=1 Tax=Rhizoctonia solani 123E TaxID=1423351 RepID=A0A074SKY0_9AGAM|nr:hypothetical protein V565_075170 [Rhizoctonia solani 123E]